jgi:hypothetical protein
VVWTDQDGYIDKDAGREGYENVRTPVVYAPVRTPATKPEKKGHLLSVRWEERLASLIAAGGAIWAVYVATTDYDNLWRLQIMPPGPIEVCALGILVWLHAKWRRSTQVR